MRRIALVGVLIVVMAGCGGQTKTVAVAKTAQPSSAAYATVATSAGAMPAPVIARVEKSVLPGSCDSTDAPSNFEGTGFIVAGGVATAAHVVAACPPGVTVSFQDGGFGWVSGSVLADDRAHDLALLRYQPSPFLPIALPPLRLESAPVYVGEPLALIGVPGLGELSGFQTQPTVVLGSVVATNQTEQLASPQGGSETLTGAILVAAPGVVPGESGGPAIDAAGKVVGVIEGSGPGIATLTPVADLTSLH